METYFLNKHMVQNNSFTDLPETAEALQLVKKEEVEKTKSVLNSYFSQGIQVFDFNDIPQHIRLSFVQKTPQIFIKTRTVGATNIPYIDHYFAEKCLNFISNFNWGSKMVRSEIAEETIETKNGKKKSYDATVEMDFWIDLGGKRIERFIVSGHRMFENPATTKADALKSAVSKANTVFARQFGVGANIIDAEGRAYDAIMNAVDIASPKITVPEKKEFNKDDFTKPVKKEEPKKVIHKMQEIKEEPEQVNFEVPKFIADIARCKSFDELNKRKEAFKIVTDLENKGGLGDFQIEVIWKALHTKLKEFPIGQKEPQIVTEEYLQNLFTPEK